MKKITNFIVDKRHLILFIFIILTGLSAFLSTKVGVNKDLTEYLPSDSDTKLGMNLMESNFSDVDNTSTLNIMFKNLSNKEKEVIINTLKDIKGIESVDYDESDFYNKGEYTLFSINVDDSSDSKISKTIYETVQEKFENYEIYMSGTIASSNTPILPTWILVVSITSAVIILIIMCDSYIEPFLFLAVILMAVVINYGTNIIFKNVSDITNSISAILQMALSMDYSIMLISRFREESLKEKNKTKAMKNALYHSFQAITSSSLTTIVGLITLIFMSFTIGKDLGLVLAKGVLLSLICIFLALPTLILMCNKLITKTEKKTINIKLNLLGKISYKLKYPLTLLFIFVFVGSYLLKGNLGILYTHTESNKVDEVFGSTNQIIGVYNNKDEDKIYEYIKYLEENKNIKSVLSYSNTINEKIKYNELNSKIKSISNKININIDEELLKIIYYKYYNKEINNRLTINELINTLNKLNDETISNEINKIYYFTNTSEINKERTSLELSNILNIKEEDINNLLTLYRIKNNNTELTIKELIDFINEDILTNEEYKNNLDSSVIEKLNTLTIFTDENINKTPLSSIELSKLFNIDENLIKELILLNHLTKEDESKFSLPEFINEVINIKNNTNLLDGIDISKLEKLSIFTQNKNNLLTTKMTKSELSTLFGSELINNYYLVESILDTEVFTPEELINNVLNSSLINLLDEDKLKELNLLKVIIDDTLNSNPNKYTSAELSIILNTDKNEIIKLYTLINYINGNTDNWKLTPLELINTILNNKDNPQISNVLNDELINNLNLLKTVMENPYTKYNSSNIKTLLNIEDNNIDLIYGLYTVKYIKTENKISLNTLINFMLQEENEHLIDLNNKNKLKTLNRIMYSSINNIKYTPKEMHNLLSALTNELDENSVKLLYIYHGSINSYNNEWTLTIEELMNFLNEEIINDKVFSSYITNELKNDIILNNELIKKSKKSLIGEKYSRILINTDYEYEADNTFKFLEDFKELTKDNIEIYLVGDSPMAHEMSKTFVKEFNYISILTMISLFIVVAITFKSLIIPFILVLLIQSAVYLTMGILSLAGVKVYFIAILVVQSILMGATIDYAILYTSYYIENRNKLDIKSSIINSYNSAIHTIMTSASILIIVTLILGLFSSGITSIICKTIAEGTLCSSLLILLILPGVIAALDKFIIKRK